MSWNGPSKSTDSLGELLGDLMVQSAELVKGEIALAKAEVSDKIRGYRSAACSAALGAAIGFLASIAFLAAGIIALSAYVGLLAAALICGALLGVAAAVLIVRGVVHVKRLST